MRRPGSCCTDVPVLLPGSPGGAGDLPGAGDAAGAGDSRPSGVPLLAATHHLGARKFWQQRCTSSTCAEGNAIACTRRALHVALHACSWLHHQRAHRDEVVCIAWIACTCAINWHQCAMAVAVSRRLQRAAAAAGVALGRQRRRWRRHADGGLLVPSACLISSWKGRGSKSMPARARAGQRRSWPADERRARNLGLLQDHKRAVMVE